MPNVSKEHCLIQVDHRGQAWIKDTSTNGTLVNGECVKEHLLHDKDVFTISDRSFTFEYYRHGEMMLLKSDSITPSKVNTPAHFSSSSRKNQVFEVNSKENQPSHQQLLTHSNVKSTSKRTPGLSRVWSVSKTDESSTRKSNSSVPFQVETSQSMLPLIAFTPHREKEFKSIGSPIGSMVGGRSSSLRKKIK